MPTLSRKVSACACTTGGGAPQDRTAALAATLINAKRSFMTTPSRRRLSRLKAGGCPEGAFVSAASRFAITFGGPLLLLAAAGMTAWLALGDAQTSSGPMRLAPLPPRLSQTPDLVPDGPPPTTLEVLSPAQAELRNALLPYSSAPLLAGAGFAAGREDAATASQCMTQAIYYEAGSEPDAGKRAVAQVILNRVASPAFPKSVCAVVQEGANRPAASSLSCATVRFQGRPIPPAGRAPTRSLRMPLKATLTLQ